MSDLIFMQDLERGEGGEAADGANGAQIVAAANIAEVATFNTSEYPTNSGYFIQFAVALIILLKSVITMLINAVSRTATYLECGHW